MALRNQVGRCVIYLSYHCGQKADRKPLKEKGDCGSLSPEGTVDWGGEGLMAEVAWPAMAVGARGCLLTSG